MDQPTTPIVAEAGDEGPMSTKITKPDMVNMAHITEVGEWPEGVKVTMGTPMPYCSGAYFTEEHTRDLELVISVRIPYRLMHEAENWAKPIIRGLAVMAKTVWEEYSRWRGPGGPRK
jgi:hypothetical protein